jgi:hypothetical protein
LSYGIKGTSAYVNVKELRKNIAYSLQHIEFLDRCLQDLKLTDMLKAMLRKSIIVAGCGVIEGLLHFLIIKHGKQTMIEWSFTGSFKTNPKSVNGVTMKFETFVYEQLASPIVGEMKFEAMIAKAQTHHLLGANNNIYPILKQLRPLRNKVHLQDGGEDDTDWYSFTKDNVALMAKVLRLVFTGTLFMPSSTQKAYFDYLKNDFAH